MDYNATFLTRDSSFYKTLLHLMLGIVLQNVITYSVNMADNIMLGNYSQDALSGAATANMIQFILQTVVAQTAEASVIIGSQYWAQKKYDSVRSVLWMSMRTVFVAGVIFMLLTTFIPVQILSVFTARDAYIESGMEYLRIIRFTYPVYAISMALMAGNRTEGRVNINLGVSTMALFVNVGINYVLIFGKFGFPEMGITGAAIGTLAARVLGLAVLVLVQIFGKNTIRMFKGNIFTGSAALRKTYAVKAFSFAFSGLLWAVATPLQTGILGRLSDDAIAANSVSTTLYQYLKVIAQGGASAAVVISGRAVGEGNMDKVRSYTRTLQIIFIGIGVVLSAALFFVRIPILASYDLSDNARRMANDLLLLLCPIMLGMSYQQPTGYGIIKGGGDSRFILFLNIISTWCIVIPLSFAAAFWWKLPVVAVVGILNSDQIFKALPVAIRANRYKWVHILTEKPASDTSEQ